jgi:hypothetical protein
MPEEFAGDCDRFVMSTRFGGDMRERPENGPFLRLYDGIISRRLAELIWLQAGF